MKKNNPATKLENPNRSNPWIGWHQYTEEALSQGVRFVGRSKESAELYSIIENNLLTTVYGKSGIGKSSLLYAGVSPSLRAADYVPVICRCTTGHDYVKSISEDIKKCCDILEAQVANPGSSLEEQVANPGSSLVEFFKNIRFTKNGNEVFPVLIFDQFEDWYRINTDSVNSLLSDIAYLISENYSGVTNYRFVITIREDYLYLIEDSIDNGNLFELSQNRYRLTQLNREQAEEIFNLGDVAGEVKEELLILSKSGVGYNPGLLSFYCHHLYNRFPAAITAEALSLLADRKLLIESYYEDCYKAKGISKSTRSFVETHLQEGGLRKPVNIKFIRQHIPNEELTLLISGDKRLLRKFPVGEDEYVELIHDSIAEIIQKQILRKGLDVKRRAVTLTLSLYYFLVGIFVLWPSLTEIMHASWIYMSESNISDYIGSICPDIDIHSALPINLCKSLLISKLGGYIVFLYLCLYSIPKLICQYYYKSVPVLQTIATAIAALVTFILSTDGLLKFELGGNTILYSIILWIIFIIVIVARKKNLFNSKTKVDE